MTVLQRILLGASTNAWLRDRAMKAPFVMRSVSRFMPGERVEDALAAAVRLQHEGMTTILAHLGENLTTRDEAEEVLQHYLDLLTRVSASGLDAHISIKLTQLGLDLDPELCRRQLQQIVDRGRELQLFVWIDMENARYVDQTLQLYRLMRQRSQGVGVALQSYLRRTEGDLESLLPLAPSVRLVKGAYLESSDLVYARKSDVDANYFRLATRVLSQREPAGGLLHLATHDAALVDRLATMIAAHDPVRPACEYAMLYGIQRSLQRRLAASGSRVRVLISYGRHWFPWYMRRLAERPANVWFVIKQALM